MRERDGKVGCQELRGEREDRGKLGPEHELSSRGEGK